MSWRDRIAKTLAGKLPMDEASRMARARELGYDVDRPLYHSTINPRLEEFEPHGRFMGRHGLAGISLTDNPAMARRYLDRYVVGDPSVGKYFIKPGVVREFDRPLPSRTPMGFPLPEGYAWPHSLEGVDTAVFPDTITARGGVSHLPHGPTSKMLEGREHILRDPSRIRDAFAAFNPENEGLAKLLGSLAAVPAGIGAVADQSQYGAPR